MDKQQEPRIVYHGEWFLTPTPHQVPPPTTVSTHVPQNTTLKK